MIEPGPSQRHPVILARDTIKIQEISLKSEKTLYIPIVFNFELFSSS